MLTQFPLNGDNSKARGLLNFIIQVVMRISSNYSPFRLLLKYEAISFEFDMNWNLQITWKLGHYVNSKVTVYLLIVICVMLCCLVEMKINTRRIFSVNALHLTILCQIYVDQNQYEFSWVEFKFTFQVPVPVPVPESQRFHWNMHLWQF